MHYRTPTAFLAAALLIGCGGEATEEAAPAAELSPDEQAIDELRSYYETHYNMQHASMVVTKYEEEAWRLPAEGGFIEGRAAVEAHLAEGMTSAPTVTITGAETMIWGDLSVNLGSYAVEVAPEGGEAMTWSGTYLNVLSKASGEWRILGDILNYDAPRPEGWSWAEPMAEAPEDEGTMGEVVDYFMTHWNMGHADMVAELYTEDAVVSFSDGPILRGRSAVQASLDAGRSGDATITIHDVGTMELAEGWALDGGWYQIDAVDGSGPLQVGSYLNLVQQQEDGSWKIHWGVSNAQPPAM